MPPTVDNHLKSAESPAGDDEGTGLAILRTWRDLYIFVAVVFATWVVILYALTRAFS
jgi:hypothetical protein